jgi:ELWxxDGT repeat protein
LYFRADDGVHGSELWRSDGTAAGTAQVKDVAAGAGGSYPSGLAVLGSTLFFSAGGGATGRELWKSDGTAAGTVLVKDIRPGATSGYPSYLAAAGGILFFSAGDGINGYELWKSDGSTAGTTLVKDIDPGSPSSFPFPLIAVGGKVFFTANDGTGGYDLWTSDGSAAGTVRLLHVSSDATPPETTIDAGPTNGSTITTTSASFTFSGTPGDTARFQCSLDGGPFNGCTSPHTFTGLSEGPHTVAVRAIDAASNVDPTPAQRTLTVDTTSASPGAAPKNKIHAPAGGVPNKRKGTLTLWVELPGPGTVVLTPAGRSPVRTARKTTATNGATRVVIRPTRHGLKKLEGKRNHKLKVKVQLTFTPLGGTPYTVTKRYTLSLK